MREITIYSKPDCRYCIMLKKWLDVKNIEFKEINISENEEAADFIHENGKKTVPQVVINGEFRSHEPYNNLLNYL